MLSKLEHHVLEFSHALTGPAQIGGCNFIQKIKQTSRISPEVALEIYRNNTRGARINTLEVIYPACKRILGDDTFRAIAREYVISDIYGTADLNDYGKTLSQFFESLLDANRLPCDLNYLPDLARLEHLYHAAYYTDDDPEFDFHLFEQMVNADKTIHFKLSVSLALLSSRYPVYQIWLNNNKQNDATDVKAIKATQYLLVYRKNNRPMIAAINVCEYHLLEIFSHNRSLQYAVKYIDCNMDEVLPKLIARQWIVGIRKGGIR